MVKFIALQPNIHADVELVFASAMMGRMSRSHAVIIILGTLIMVGGWMTLMVREERKVAPAIDAQQRFKEWAVVTRTKALSASEELSLVTVPSEFGKVFDVRCLVYKNREFNHVTFTCPDAKQDQLEEGPER